LPIPGPAKSAILPLAIVTSAEETVCSIEDGGQYQEHRGA
jgi:hypothetical protein